MLSRIKLGAAIAIGLLAWQWILGTQPNIVLVMADDAGLGDLGCYGAFTTQYANTPELDRLAKEGIRFSNAYTPGSMCWPTRGSLLTGRYPMRWDNRAEVPVEIPKLGTLLQQAGYYTMMVGKTHNGIENGNMPPTDWGYDRYAMSYTAHDYFMTMTAPGMGDQVFTGFIGPGCSLNNPSSDIGPIEYNPETLLITKRAGILRRKGYSDMDSWRAEMRTKIRTVPNDWAMRYAPVIESDPGSPGGFRYVTDFGSYTVENKITGKKEKFGYLPEYYNRTAVRFIREHVHTNPNQPFFLYFPRMAPHVPVQTPPLELLDPSRRKLWSNIGPRQRALTMDIVDKGMGDIIDTLEALGIRDNTVVIFCSDNGGNDDATGNLRGKKGNLFEGGIRTPMIMSWPDGLQNPGRDFDQAITLMDLAPTFLNLAGYAGQVDMDGVDLSPHLNNPELIIERNLNGLFWAKDGGRNFAVRLEQRGSKGELIHVWKLYGEKENQVKLFDLLKDPFEKEPLDNKPCQDQLLKIVADWLNEVR